MAQNPQRRSQPSATLTYAQGAVAGGRRQLQQVEVGWRLAAKRWIRPCPHNSTGQSSSRRARRNRRRDRSRRSQPQAPHPSAPQGIPSRRVENPGFRMLSSSRIVSTDSSRAASMKAQVLTTTRSASPGFLCRLVAGCHQATDQLVRVDLILRATERRDPEALVHPRSVAMRANGACAILRAGQVARGVSARTRHR